MELVLAFADCLRQRLKDNQAHGFFLFACTTAEPPYLIAKNGENVVSIIFGDSWRYYYDRQDLWRNHSITVASGPPFCDRFVDPYTADVDCLIEQIMQYLILGMIVDKQHIGVMCADLVARQTGLYGA